MLPDDPLEPPGALPRPLPALAWRDRAADVVALAAGRPVAAGLLVVLLLGAVLVLGPMVRGVASEPSHQPVEATLPMAGTATTSVPGATAGPTGAADGTGTTVAGSAGEAAGAAVALVVHAAGAVAAPGVYELPAGSRVDDLVAAAGGLAPDADGDRVNLALPLVDGERTYVPRVGEEVLPEAPGPSGSAAPTAGEPSAEAPTSPIDLNTASVAELESLPGVGPVTAEAIVDHREQQGPFTSVDDLLDVQGIGEARLAQMRERVTV